MEKMTGISAQAAFDGQEQQIRPVRHILSRTVGLLRRLGDRYRAATGLRQLESMSDWQLRDIGIDRCRIHYGIRPQRESSGHAAD
jgi:uncharacterized protein YjiS (DUF1127 family)